MGQYTLPWVTLRTSHRVNTTGVIGIVCLPHGLYSYSPMLVSFHTLTLARVDILLGSPITTKIYQSTSYTTLSRNILLFLPFTDPVPPSTV